MPGTWLARSTCCQISTCLGTFGCGDKRVMVVARHNGWMGNLFFLLISRHTPKSGVCKGHEVKLSVLFVCFCFDSHGYFCDAESPNGVL